MRAFVHAVVVVAFALLTVMLLAVSAADAQTITPTCTPNADGLTKTCVGDSAYDNLARYALDAEACNPATSDCARVSGVILPLCSQVEVTRPSGKIQIKWVCNKDLNVIFTLTKQ